MMHDSDFSDTNIPNFVFHYISRMICSNCNKDYNLNEKGSSASYCEDCAEMNDSLWDGTKKIERTPESQIISLVESISSNVCILTIIVVIQFIISLAIVLWLAVISS